jgi:hypothetical protein
VVSRKSKSTLPGSLPGSANGYGPYDWLNRQRPEELQDGLL